VGQQHLGGLQPVLRERRLVRLHSPIWPTAAAACSSWIARAASPAESQHALGDRTRRDEDDVAAAALQRRDLAAQRATAAWSSPRPSLVTRLDPTLTTTRLRPQPALAELARFAARSSSCPAARGMGATGAGSARRRAAGSTRRTSLTAVEWPVAATSVAGGVRRMRVEPVLDRERQLRGNRRR
jgi:hypothetical protein